MKDTKGQHANDGERAEPVPESAVSAERRFWARMIDVLIISGFGQPLALLLWVPLEALFLSRWGYTPGKWLLGVRVCDAEGKSLKFDVALHRAFLVWLKGLCLGISIGWVVSCPIAYRVLKREGKTTWDQALNLQVEQGAVPKNRKLIIGLLIFFYIAVFAALVTWFALSPASGAQT